jgi:peptidyl-prolyl cis-trans isomerase D
LGLSAGSDITSDPKIVSAAFSGDVLKGNNSEPIELGTDKLVVLRMLEHRQAKVKELEEMRGQIVAELSKDMAKKIVAETAEKIKLAVVAGKSMSVVAQENNLTVKTLSGLARSNKDVSWLVNQGIFKAAKPVNGKATVLTVSEPSGVQTVINVLAVAEGEMSESDKEKMKLAKENMAKAFGEAEFNATLNSLRAGTDVSINTEE